MTSLSNFTTVSRQVLASKWVWRVLLGLYVAVLLILFAPVLTSSIGADDSYWVLLTAPDAQGSVWQAFWEPLGHAFDFEGQSRTTALTTAERQVLAVVAMEVATLFAIPPAVTWAVVKLSLLLLGILAIALLLHQVRFRDRHGLIQKISSPSITFVILLLPLVVALGVKSQNVGTLNGWNFYPSITYGALPVCLLVATLALAGSRLLQRSYRRWALPLIGVLMLVALMVNLSYEFIALSIPLSVLLLVLDPLPEGPSFWGRWKGKITVVAALAGTYSAIFFWVRWRISQMPCHDTDSCYSGTLIDVDLRTLFYNFLGAFPGGTGAFVTEQAIAAGSSIPFANGWSVAVGVCAALLALGLWVNWSLRRAQALSGAAISTGASGGRGDIRGLLLVAVTGVVIAVGAAVITGITERAVELVQTPMLAYRNSIITWMAIAMAAVACVRILAVLWPRVVGRMAVAALMVIAIVAISLYLPRNVMTAQANRSDDGIRFVDTLHWEVAMGDTSKVGDSRRCDSIQDWETRHANLSARYKQSLKGAYSSFDYYHGKPYCSLGFGQD